MRSIVIACLVLAATGSALAQQPIAVFITAPTRGGFIDTDQEIQDSVKDLKNRVRRLKGVRLLDAREGADVVLTVAARGVGSREYGQRLNYTELYGGNVEIKNQPMVADTYWVTAILRAGDYRKELSGAYTNDVGFSAGAWGDCANQISKALGVWIHANRDQLIAKRQQ